MDTFIILSASGEGSVEFFDREPGTLDKPTEYFSVRIRDRNLTAQARVYACAHPPMSLFEEMARRWNGWQGELNWESIEGELRLRCTRDRFGHIAIRGNYAPDQRQKIGWYGQRSLPKPGSLKPSPDKPPCSSGSRMLDFPTICTGPERGETNRRRDFYQPVPNETTLVQLHRRSQMPRAKNNGNGKLEEALLKLLQSQTSLVEAHSSLAQTQASTMQTQAALTQTHNAFVARMADMDARWAESERRRTEFERTAVERFAELSTRLDEVEAILAEHSQILESLPDRVREILDSLPDKIGAKFGFHMPEPKTEK